MSRDDGWRFLVLGRSIERLDMTARLLSVRLSQPRAPLRLGDDASAHARPTRHSFAPTGAAERGRAVEFLLLDRLCPRSVYFALVSASTCLAEIGGSRGGSGRPTKPPASSGAPGRPSSTRASASSVTISPRTSSSFSARAPTSGLPSPSATSTTTPSSGGASRATSPQEGRCRHDEQDRHSPRLDVSLRRARRRLLQRGAYDAGHERPSDVALLRAEREPDRVALPVRRLLGYGGSLLRRARAALGAVDHGDLARRDGGASGA